MASLSVLDIILNQGFTQVQELNGCKWQKKCDGYVSKYKQSFKSWWILTLSHLERFTFHDNYAQNLFYTNYRNCIIQWQHLLPSLHNIRCKREKHSVDIRENPSLNTVSILFYQTDLKYTMKLYSHSWNHLKYLCFMERLNQSIFLNNLAPWASVAQLEGKAVSTTGAAMYHVGDSPTQRTILDSNSNTQALTEWNGTSYMLLLLAGMVPKASGRGRLPSMLHCLQW